MDVSLVSIVTKTRFILSTTSPTLHGAAMEKQIFLYFLFYLHQACTRHTFQHLILQTKNETLFQWNVKMREVISSDLFAHQAQSLDVQVNVFSFSRSSGRSSFKTNGCLSVSLLHSLEEICCGGNSYPQPHRHHSEQLWFCTYLKIVIFSCSVKFNLKTFLITLCDLLKLLQITFVLCLFWKCLWKKKKD